MNNFWKTVTSPAARKFQVAIVGVLLSAATAGLLPAAVSVWVILVINAFVAAGVFTLPNTPQKLVVQPAGTDPEKADIVVEAPAEVAKALDRGTTKG